MDFQVLSHEVHTNGAVELFGRDKDGNARSTHTKAFPGTWYWHTGAGPCPSTCSRTVHVRARCLYADHVDTFKKITWKTRAPRITDDRGWYGRKLDRYHAHCAKTGTPPCSWFDPISSSLQYGPPAPATLVSIDIEAQPGPNMEFPDAARDPILQISVVCDTNAFSDQSSCTMHILCIGSLPHTLPKLDEFDPEGTVMHCFDTEIEMMRAFEQLTAKLNPDIITGWNIDGFDLPYICERYSNISGGHMPALGRHREKARVFNSKQGKRCILRGRIIADLLRLWRSEHKERSYSLENVARTHLGASKAPITYNQIRQLQLSEDGRARMATYCVKDSHLVWQLGRKRKKWINALEMSNVTYVPLQHIFSRGQQWKVFSLITHYAHNSDPPILIPDAPPPSTAGYEGAVVINPIPGFYKECVSTLDFASLYPSIMIAFNMCYSTRRPAVSEWELARSIGVPLNAARRIMAFMNQGELDTIKRAVPADARAWHRCGNVAFSKQSEGLLPKILKTLLANRKKAKKAMAAAGDPLQKSILDGKQLALKLCANSLYGFTGTSQEVGMLPCPEIASAVTFMGRKLTLNTKRICERDFDVTGCYGDTDSVFLHQRGVSDVRVAAEHAEKMASHVNKMLPPPILLEFEKVYKPLLLLKKKRYCGMKYEEGQEPPSMDVKGLEMVRRDNFPLLPKTMRSAVDALMNTDVAGALETTASAMRYIRSEQTVDMQQLEIAKELTKPAADYGSMPPHVVVAARTGAAVHDRVPYLVAIGNGGIGDRAVHPMEWDATNHEIDREWYAQQLAKSMERLLAPCCSPETLQAALDAGTEDQICGTSDSGILHALGVTPGQVWRKRRIPNAQPDEVRRVRQQTLQGFFTQNSRLL